MTFAGQDIFFSFSHDFQKDSELSKFDLAYTGCFQFPKNSIGHSTIRVFHSLYKVGRNGNFVFKGFNNSKKRVTSSGARPDATDYYWSRSPVPNHMS